MIVWWEWQIGEFAAFVQPRTLCSTNCCGIAVSARKECYFAIATDRVHQYHDATHMFSIRDAVSFVTNRNVRVGGVGFISQRVGDLLFRRRVVP